MNLGSFMLCVLVKWGNELYYIATNIYQVIIIKNNKIYPFFIICLQNYKKNCLRSNNQESHLQPNLLLRVENILHFMLFITFPNSKVPESHPELFKVFFQIKTRVHQVAREAQARPIGGIARIAGGSPGGH